MHTLRTGSRSLYTVQVVVAELAVNRREKLQGVVLEFGLGVGEFRLQLFI
jgi:hypothetical protein